MGTCDCIDPIDGGPGDLEPLGFATLEDGDGPELEDELPDGPWTIEIPPTSPFHDLPLHIGDTDRASELGERLLAPYARSLVGRLETDRALELVEQEMQRQDAKWGEQNHPLVPWDGGKQKGYKQLADWHRTDNDYRVSKDELSWDGILLEEVYEALAEPEGSEELENELLQVAAVAVQMWLAQRRKKLTDEDAIAILRRLMLAGAEVAG